MPRPTLHEALTTVELTIAGAVDDIQTGAIGGAAAADDIQGAWAVVHEATQVLALAVTALKRCNRGDLFEVLAALDRDADGPTVYEDTGDPIFDETKDAYSVWMYTDDSGRQQGRDHLARHRQRMGAGVNVTVLVAGELKGVPCEWGVELATNDIMQRVVGRPWRWLTTGHKTYRDACEAVGNLVPAFEIKHAKFLVPYDRRG